MEYSVLMTVYKSDNAEHFDLALKSMLTQTKKPDEIVLVKDGPIPEELQAVIDRNAAETEVYIHEVQLPQNVGLGLALNEGIKVARNELLARMDSDDISLPERCEKQLAFFEADPELDIVGCPVIEFSGEPSNVVGKRDVPLTNKEIHKYARRRDPFNHPTVMYKKSKVEAVGCYGNYRKNQDTALWIELLHSGCKAANVGEYLLNFRFDEGTYKKRKSWTNTKLLIKIRWRGFRIKFNSFFDFLAVAIMQLGIYIMPVKFQRFVYTKILRKGKKEKSKE